MASEVKAWRAKDGSLHDTQVEAARRNIEIILTTAFGDDWNKSVGLPEVMIFLLDRREDILIALTDYHRAAPVSAKSEAPPESQKGPGRDPELQEPIPELVYWSEEHGNFYGQVSRRGQGQQFYNYWFPRRAEFPTTAHEDDKPVVEHSDDFLDGRDLIRDN